MDSDSRFKRILLTILFVLLAAIVFGLIWFFFLGPSIPVGLGWYLFSFTAGLSMIVLPCTLPLAFVIVPLSMGKGAFKGFMIAVFFGLGVAITLSLYGVFAAILGKVAIGTLGAPLEVVKNWLYFIAGIFAYLFALGELGLINFKMPSYSGAFPGFIQRQQDVIKALLLGLFLGNIGVGCPHPATPVILTRIAVSGDIFYGWFLFLVHAIGRVLPLIFLAILGILGVNALAGLVAHKAKIERATGWAMVFVASFILILGLFSHDWWVLSGQHTFLESITQEETFLNFLGTKLGTGNVHHHSLPPEDHAGLFGLPLAWGTGALLLLWIVPLWWYYKKEKNKISSMASPEKEERNATIPYLFWNFLSLSLILVLIFGYILPHRFLEQASAQRMDSHMSGMEHMHMGPTINHEESEVNEGLVVNLTTTPLIPKAGEKSSFDFFVNKKPESTPIPIEQLEIEHKKRMHVVGVRNDLNEFFHIHPEPHGAPGHMTIDHTFAKPGVYKIWSDVTEGGTTHIFGHPMLTVSGPGPTIEPNKEIIKEKIVENHGIKILYNNLFVGAESDIEFAIKNADGKQADLNDYLGATMHLIFISEDLKDFIHAHPEGMMMSESRSLFPIAFAHGTEETEMHTTSEVGGDEGLRFHVTFPREGFYKAFAQFSPKDANLGPDEALTAEFWVQVGKQSTLSENSSIASPGSSAWFRNLVVALILMAVLGWGIKKYITV